MVLRYDGCYDSGTCPHGYGTIVCQNGEFNEASTNKLFGRRALVAPQTAMILHD